MKRGWIHERSLMGPTKDQVIEMEGEGRAQVPGQEPPPNTDDSCGSPSAEERPRLAPSADSLLIWSEMR